MFLKYKGQGFEIYGPGEQKRGGVQICHDSSPGETLPT